MIDFANPANPPAQPDCILPEPDVRAMIRAINDRINVRHDDPTGPADLLTLSVVFQFPISDEVIPYEVHGAKDLKWGLFLEWKAVAMAVKPTADGRRILVDYMLEQMDP